MAEELTLLLVAELLKELYVAFPTHTGMKSNPEGTAKVYRDHLHGLSGEALRASVRIVIASDQYFPKVARLREVAWDWTKRHQVDLEPAYRDPMYCPRCQSRVQLVTLWRPKVDGDGYVAMSDDRQYVALERIARDLCKCAAPSKYTPEPEFEDAWMRADRIAWLRVIGRGPRPLPAKTNEQRQRALAKAAQLMSAGDVAEQLVESAMVHHE